MRQPALPLPRVRSVLKRSEASMKRIIAGVLTLLIAGALLWTGLRREPGPLESPRDPFASSPVQTEPALAAEEFLRHTLETARKGDVAAYLSSFGGALRQRLQDEVEQQGNAAFAALLQKAAQARKGHAMYAPEPDGSDAYVITVDSVYPDRNERQAYRLERISGTWLITAVEPARPYSQHQVRRASGLPAPPGCTRAGARDGRDAPGPVTSRRSPPFASELFS